uniref:Uncharacterized protein n=1 Tax=Rangifer tarandus platyrhynchus TaxID=3082113 RepID=A0ACB0F6A3_RANTA|nr:unnamed protein product [Rangifer tarandus platyrhynchus]
MSSPRSPQRSLQPPAPRSPPCWTVLDVSQSGPIAPLPLTTPPPPPVRLRRQTGPRTPEEAPLQPKAGVSPEPGAGSPKPAQLSCFCGHGRKGKASSLSSLSVRSARGYRCLGQVDAFPLFWPQRENAEHPRLPEAQGPPTSLREAERHCCPAEQLHAERSLTGTSSIHIS